MGVEFYEAATAIPPGIISGNVKVISNVVESVGLDVVNVIDEPTAAASVLGITDGAVVDVGGGGMQITIFSKGKVITTQHLGLGTIRMQEQLAKKSCSLEQYELQIEELVEKELNVFMAMFTEQA